MYEHEIEVEEKQKIYVPSGYLSGCLKKAERWVKQILGLGGISVFYEIRGKSPYDRITLSVLPLSDANRKIILKDRSYMTIAEKMSDRLAVPFLVFVVRDDMVYFALRRAGDRTYTKHIATHEEFWEFFHLQDFHRATPWHGKLPKEDTDSEDWYSVNHHSLPRNFYSIDIDSLHPHDDSETPLCIEIKREGESLTYNQRVGFRILQEKTGAVFRIYYLKEIWTRKRAITPGLSRHTKTVHSA
ncbi:hypothetical protein [Hydrogenivirga sp.]